MLDVSSLVNSISLCSFSYNMSFQPATNPSKLTLALNTVSEEKLNPKYSCHLRQTSLLPLKYIPDETKLHE